MKLLVEEVLTQYLCRSHQYESPLQVTSRFKHVILLKRRRLFAAPVAPRDELNMPVYLLYLHVRGVAKKSKGVNQKWLRKSEKDGSQAHFEKVLFLTLVLLVLKSGRYSMPKGDVTQGVILNNFCFDTLAMRHPLSASTNCRYKTTLDSPCVK